MCVCDLAGQWRTVHYFASPKEVLERLKFGTVGIRRRFHACVYEFLTMVTEGVVHVVHKVVIWSSFAVILRHKVS